MVVVGVKFKKAGKLYYFDPDGIEIPVETPVIVETARGIEFGTVLLTNKEVSEDEIVPPLKKIIRIATQEDILENENNKEKEIKAFDICIEKILQHNLDMKLIDVEFTFDHNKIIFYFTSEGRVDFRELVKELASIFRTRIELRQIGVRDEAKMLNGIGICGRTLCCATFLGDFQPVSIKMAKEQNLSLNPSKISGICSRLMCCLKYEEDTYEELNKILPDIGDYVSTPDGEGDVLSVNVLRQLVKVGVKKRENNDLLLNYYDASEIKVLIKRGKENNIDENISQEELKALEDR